MQPELKNKSDVSIVLVMFTALAILGVAGGGFFVEDFARARASHGWPVVEGVVLSRLDGRAQPARYIYSMGGRSFESTRARAFVGHFLPRDSRDLRPGETVMVYVNPDDHAYSVLQPGGSVAAFIVFSLLSGGAVFFGIGGVVWTLARASAHDLHTAEETA